MAAARVPARPRGKEQVGTVRGTARNGAFLGALFPSRVRLSAALTCPPKDPTKHAHLFLLPLSKRSAPTPHSPAFPVFHVSPA
eukprot:7379312-Prymnesium_polylepis.1